MKKVFVSVLLMTATIFAFAQKTINEPNAQKRSVSGYHGVSVSGNIELFLSQGTEESVVIAADDTKWRDKVITDVEDGILRIYMEHDKNQIHLDLNSAKKIRAYVSVKDIDYLSSSGSGKTHLEGTIKADKLKVSIKVNEFSVGISGSANTELNGTAEKSDFHISGSGNIRGYDFSTSYCTASISGSGDVKITVTKELSAHISGSGNIMIKGDGMIRDYSASGSGKFKRVN